MENKEEEDAESQSVQKLLEALKQSSSMVIQKAFHEFMRLEHTDKKHAREDEDDDEKVRKTTVLFAFPESKIADKSSYWGVQRLEECRKTACEGASTEDKTTKTLSRRRSRTQVPILWKDFRLESKRISPIKPHLLSLWSKPCFEAKTTLPIL